jgi:hypothetical protein
VVLERIRKEQNHEAEVRCRLDSIHGPGWDYHGRSITRQGTPRRASSPAEKQVPGEPQISVRSCSVDAGRTAGTKPLRCSSVAPGDRTAKAPAKGLSTLNSMAFGLAVYASQCGLPTPHARLASPPEADWSDTTGRASHPQGPTERFQSCLLHLIPLSQASCRNRSDRSRLRRADRCTPPNDQDHRPAIRRVR